MLGAAVARCSGSRRRPALTEGAVAAKTRHPRVDGGLMRPWGKPRTSTSAAAGMAWSAMRSLRTGWVGGGSGWSVAAGGLTDRGWGGPQRHGGRGRRSGAERRKRASLIRELTEGESGDAAWRRCFGDKASTVARKGRKANGRSTTTRLREPTPLGSGAAAARRKRFNVGVNVHDAAVPGRRATSSDAASVSPDVAVEDDDVDGAEAATPAWALGAAAGGMLGVAPERVQQVMRQALPVMGGMASQNVLNLADTVMVGRLGTACVAAVGISSTLNFQCQAALQGISSGVQAMSARRIGEERRDVAAVPLNAALVMCLLFGVPMAVAGIIYAPTVVPKLTTDPAVIAASIPYLQARLCAVPAVGINFAFRGFWNAVQRPHVYMNTLLVMHAVNITLSLLLIFGCPSVGVPAMGVVGAGVGTAVSVWVGTALYLWRGFCEAREMGFACEAPKPSDVKTLAMQAVPTSITNLLFATGMTTLYWIVGHLGTAEVAAVNVLINLMLTLVLPCMGMGLAAGALSWPWDVAKLTAAMMFGVGLIAVIFPEMILKCFLTNTEAIAKATMPLRYTGITVAGDALSVTMQNALLGVGDARRVAAISISTQWIFFLPTAYLGVTKMGWGLNFLWGLYVFQRVLQGLLFARLWHGGKWKQIKLS